MCGHDYVMSQYGQVVDVRQTAKTTAERFKMVNSIVEHTLEETGTVLKKSEVAFIVATWLLEND